MTSNDLTKERNMATFQERAGKITATAAQIAKLQGASIEATVLEKAKSSLLETGYDNWGGGTTFFTLMLEVPIPTYATIDDQREELEKSIRRRVSQIIRTEIGNSISEVVISPILSDESRPVGPVPSADVPPEEIPSFWQPGFFRLFITHVSTKKIEAHRLKSYWQRFRSRRLLPTMILNQRENGKQRSNAPSEPWTLLPPSYLQIFFPAAGVIKKSA